MSYNKSEVSKAVGWDSLEVLSIPTIEAVEEKILEAELGDFDAACQLLRWQRYCHSAFDADGFVAIKMICGATKRLMI